VTFCKNTLYTKEKIFDIFDEHLNDERKRNDKLDYESLIKKVSKNVMDDIDDKIKNDKSIKNSGSCGTTVSILRNLIELNYLLVL